MVAYDTARKNCTYNPTPTGDVLPDFTQCTPTLTAWATTVRKMKTDLSTTATPSSLTAAGATLIADLTALATSLDATTAQITALGEKYGGLECCYQLGYLNQEVSAASAITGG
jgi:hypothetical protein